MRAVDVHSHIVPADFPAVPQTCQQPWPSMDHRTDNQAMVMVGKKEFRLVDSRCWDAERRIADMKKEQVGMHVLSPMPELLSYWIDAEHACQITRHVNKVIAEMVQRQPDRFQGLGMVPMQDPELAVRELAEIKRDGLLGVEIGSNINGCPPGDAKYDTFFAELERLDLCVFVHALHPTAVDRLRGPVQLVNFVLFPTEVGLAVASVISTGILDKFPRLRIGFSHAGGTTPGFLYRFDSGWRRFEELNTSFSAPLETARKFYYDNITYDPGYLRKVVDIFGATQVFVGSDYPFNGTQKESPAMFDGFGFSDEELANLKYGNARRFLGLRA